MASGTINAFNLAEAGVNVDKAQIHKDDGELTKAQNATTDPTGVGGGIRKRPGLVEFNAVAGTGSMLGGIGAPLTLRATSVGGVTLAAAARTTYWGRRSKSATVGATQGWHSSTSGFTTAATAILAGTPSNPRADAIPDGYEGLVFTAANGMPNAAAVVNNKLYYPSNSYTPNTDGAPIWVFDGVTDKKFAEIPRESSTAGYCAIMSMIAVADVLYISVYDDNNATTAVRGRVFSLDLSSGALTQLGATFSLVVPYALCWHMNRLWCGVFDTSNPGKVYFIRPGVDSAWTLDRTIGTGTNCTMLISYKGELFAGGHGNPAPIDKRNSVGTWASTTTLGGAASEITAAVVFNDNLYVAYSPTVSGIGIIAKYDGTSWTTAYNPGTVGWYGSAWVDNGVVFFGGGGHNTNNVLVSSANGSSWTDRSANLTTVGTFSGLACVGTLLT